MMSEGKFRGQSEPERVEVEPNASVDLSVIVVSYNTVHLLRKMIAAVDAARHNLTIQIIVIDNASTDGSASFLRVNYPEIDLIENSTNVGFGRANNQAVLRARGRFILLLNTDAFVAPDTLAKTVQFMRSNPSCGVLGVRITGNDGSPQPSCRYFPTPWNSFLMWSGLSNLFPSTQLVDDLSWDHSEIRECDWVPGCYYLTRREVIEEVGLFDPIYFLYYEEVDHCQAVRSAGWKVVYYPFTQVIHIGGESAQNEAALTSARQISLLQLESELIYFRKHFGLAGALSGIFFFALVHLSAASKGILSGFDVDRLSVARTNLKALCAVALKTKLGTRSSR